jgi:hypothetical protein
MIATKFTYTACPRENIEGSRHYCTPDGNKVPSVTSILSATTPEEKKESLQKWRDAIGHDKAQQITTEAANRGTRMHTYLEKYVKEGSLPVRGSNPWSWASHLMAQEVIKRGLVNVDEYWGLEVPLYFPNIYAGTTDCCGIHQGKESILDFKQSNKHKKREWIEDYFLQLAAYATAHNEVHGTNIRKGVVLMCVKPDLDPKTFAVVKPPEYQEFILEGVEFDRYQQIWWNRVEQFYLQMAQSKIDK